MYGFGDVENPRQDTVDLVEDMVIDYITETVNFFEFLKHIISNVRFPSRPMYHTLPRAWVAPQELVVSSNCELRI